jgi:hypothetical protein
MVRAALAAGTVVACQAGTTRPPFVPLPESEHGEIGLNQPNRDSSVVRVTRTLVAALKSDSIPIARVHEFDGFFDSGWFDAKTLQPTSHRPIGPNVVRVRGWVDPGKPGFSKVELETVYVPVADPSRPPRDLELAAPPDHPVVKRVAALMKDLLKKYGDPAEQAKIVPAAGGPPLKGAKGAKPDSTAGKRVVPQKLPAPIPAKRDSAAARDTTVKRDSTIKRDTSGAT